MLLEYSKRDNTSLLILWTLYKPNTQIWEEHYKNVNYWPVSFLNIGAKILD